ncbi:helix-turn-helix domain-containing protein [Dermatophilus congolensis]|uniref:helix-turn-helix domain-containing protein n=1 Tax=Dermatophilus congolensis TaxID=1863 RepID=UPI001AAE2782|nr:helix-turn-helix transcriptional regulator [Dermatophilus congolensis]MBO3141268.1 helix-turn-helix domain-containing protein [Dermatophilus congolensis]MBO3144691.1 helix-turn-helix domain-containing protein [Dermatophilus congolensis]MBO3147973.1 helix-turn-helix domain-containing protein [Dermatophilus congolensis]MBO3150253.1 helix-turn-helix domain-containing protein [Dermatophilus congolensis]MBO3153682.1 helix-turn-helix domain-containing protein [Dermatophilus congolensis]
MNQLIENFGSSLAQARRSAGLSQAQLGKPVYSRSYISLLESGARTPSEDVLQHVAAKLKIDIELVRSWAMAANEKADADAVATQVEAALLLAAGFPRFLVKSLDNKLIYPSENIRKYALESNRVDLWWVAKFLSIDVAIESDQVDEALKSSKQLLNHWLTFRSPLLEARARTRLSVCLRLSEKLQDAVDQATAALEILDKTKSGNNCSVSTMTALISALGQQGRLMEALSFSQTLEERAHLSLNPIETANAYWALGNLFMSTQSHEKACEIFEKAIELIDPDRSLRRWGRLHLAAALARLRANFKVDEVSFFIEYAEKAFSITSATTDRAQLGLIRGMHATKTENWEVAQKILTKVLENEEELSLSSRADAYQYLGEALNALSNHEEASIQYRMSAQILRSKI